MRNELINLINKTLKNKKNSYFLTDDLNTSLGFISPFLLLQYFDFSCEANDFS